MQLSTRCTGQHANTARTGAADPCALAPPGLSVVSKASRKALLLRSSHAEGAQAGLWQGRCHMKQASGLGSAGRQAARCKAVCLGSQRQRMIGMHGLTGRNQSIPLSRKQSAPNALAFQHCSDTATHNINRRARATASAAQQQQPEQHPPAPWPGPRGRPHPRRPLLLSCACWPLLSSAPWQPHLAAPYLPSCLREGRRCCGDRGAVPTAAACRSCADTHC